MENAKLLQDFPDKRIGLCNIVEDRKKRSVVTFNEPSVVIVARCCDLALKRDVGAWAGCYLILYVPVIPEFPFPLSRHRILQPLVLLVSFLADISFMSEYCFAKFLKIKKKK